MGSAGAVGAGSAGIGIGAAWTGSGDVGADRPGGAGPVCGLTAEGAGSGEEGLIGVSGNGASGLMGARGSKAGLGVTTGADRGPLTCSGAAGAVGAGGAGARADALPIRTVVSVWPFGPKMPLISSGTSIFRCAARRGNWSGLS